MRIISFIDQSDVDKKILQHLGLWEESHAPPDKSQRKKEITFDPSYGGRKIEGQPANLKASLLQLGADIQPYLRARLSC